MKRLPFDKAGQWWRGNLHTHSTVSDGKRPQEYVIAAYRDEGYDFISLTDHFLKQYDYPIVDTSALRDDKITTIFGAELHGPALSHGELWHIVAVGLPLDFPPKQEHETGPDMAARAAAAGAFVGIAHPSWYNLTLSDAMQVVPYADAVEVYNSTARFDNDGGDGWYLADQISTTTGRPLLAYAADDAHFHIRPDRFGGWVWVKAEERTPEALLAALKAGSFYSSQGPTFSDIRREGDDLVITASPVDEIMLTGIGSKRRGVSEPGLTEARLPIAPFAGEWARVTIIDANGKRAWTSPFVVDEL